ncbi:Gst13 glutathione S-transferase [Monoraphidium neglectum]|uniref:Gst13 glutathione S-transferase n=1 Tax=Monoraphidium neglectum TaxID=145388 RepID=A0A0D2LYZ5_9CHLO|nr:Gst13 glutathione S-transferase [Monoraphidium neglectum]KIY96599.1 Gst13 glutathione S-transferase [Monoraphidium neglectum]|eukprot:XP_013895619.1 Gst13 glutathione S-transferase [Monoraphidium neglectum]
MAPKPVILYGSPRSGNSQKAILMCHLLGLPFELRTLNGLAGPGAEAKQAPFLRLNPLGQVPVLIDPNAAPEPALGDAGATGEPQSPEGVVIRESAAILTYLAAKYAPAASSWLPGREDPVRAARVAGWLQYSGGEVANSLQRVRGASLFGVDISPLTVQDLVASGRRVLAYLDSQLAAGVAAGRDWLVEGPSPTIADVHLFPYVALVEESSKGALLLDAYPAVRDWVARVSRLPGFVAIPDPAQQPGDASSSGGECGPSTSFGGSGGDEQQQHQQQDQQQQQRQQHAAGPLSWAARGTGALGAAAAGSWAVAFPGLGGGGGGGNGGSGGNGGGGGGGWWSGFGGGGEGGYAGIPAFDLAAADDGAQKKKKSKKQQQQQPEEDAEALAEDALLEEAEQATEDAAAAGGGGRGAAVDALITSEGELDEMLQEAGLEGDGRRHGTRRCVEVVVEGWPEVGALPKMGELKDMLSVQEGFVFDYQDVVDDRRKLEL